jgi:hypothetical protein
LKIPVFFGYSHVNFQLATRWQICKHWKALSGWILFSLTEHFFTVIEEAPRVFRTGADVNHETINPIYN